jgi:hypothetical protein
MIDAETKTPSDPVMISRYGFLYQKTPKIGKNIS